MYYLAEGDTKHTRFRNAATLAVAVHAALILGISFEASDAVSSAKQIEVVLASRPSAVAPEDAQKIAQANQAGSGDQSEVNQITSAASLPALATQVDNNPTNTFDEQTQVSEAALTTKANAARAIRTELEESQQQQSDLQGISPEVDRLSQELAMLEAELDQQTRQLADQPRVRRLTSASAKQSADAAYLLDWRQRLEAVGNKYYPEASVRYGIYGDVRLLVIILDDGSLEDVKVLSSSGFAVLDEAAIKVVRMAAPYSPFPAELKATTDKLEIIRTWQYLENQLSSAQR